MSARSTTDLIRQLVFTAHRVRHASTTTLPQPPKKVKPEHGQRIFVYNHLQTNQVVYSLTKTLRVSSPIRPVPIPNQLPPSPQPTVHATPRSQTQNNAALRQLPFNGKKTVPRALRKDLWQPLATIAFPAGRGALGLAAFQKLRELRRLHETSWDPADMVEEEEDGDDGKVRLRPLGRRERGRKLMDQKANSVADMAAVLGVLGAEGEGGEGKGKRAEGEVKQVENVVVEIRWKDLLDAEFARTWTDNVIHDSLENGSVESTYGTAAEATEVARA